MIINALITFFTTGRIKQRKLQKVSIKPNANEISFRNKYHQRRISNRLFK